MASKKTTRGTAASREQKVPTEPEGMNRGRKYSLTEMVKRMMADQEFARFIRKLLCRAHQGDTNAAKVLASYYEPRENELDRLCLSPSAKKRVIGPCTEPTVLFLLDVPAYVAATRRG
jgi:hypothetical protein